MKPEEIAASLHPLEIKVYEAFPERDRFRHDCHDPEQCFSVAGKPVAVFLVAAEEPRCVILGAFLKTGACFAT